MTPLIGPDSLAFLDGYLFRVMVDILRSEDAEVSGLFEYYEARIRKERCALSAYDRMLFNYVLANFDQERRRIVHAGIGIGTLTSALAVSGYTVAGVEYNARRFRLAGRIRAALADAWVTVAEQYVLIEGEFPAVLTETAWIAPETILLFTNCGAGWSEELTTQIIASLSDYGDVILDARLFGNTRNSPHERQMLLDRIEGQGLAAMPISGSPPDSFYYHVQHRNGAR